MPDVSTMPRWWVTLAVAAGGALGTVARYELSLAEPVRAGRFPWTTFGVNISGCLLLGVVLAALVDGSPSRFVRPFLAVGFCGGLTTFSTWMVESVLLVRDGHGTTAAGYVVASLVAGFVAVAAGVFGTRFVLQRRSGLTFDPRSDD